MNTTPLLCLLATAAAAAGFPYPIVDTGQVLCYDESRTIQPPAPGEPFHGQDGNYAGHQPAYRDHGDGTVSDLVTGLMWQQDPGDKMTWQEAVAGAAKCRLGGHTDWRLPTIKELYSLILFSGADPDPHGTDTSRLRPFIDHRHFRFHYGDPARGERIIDAQFASATKYVSTTMRGNQTMFGVNFADGRIKGYPSNAPRGREPKKYFVLYVRDNPDYGRNDFHDNGDDTVTDRATGLTWMKRDSGHLMAGPAGDGRMNWQQALDWAESLELAGHSDWRLPDAKELQSIIDYTRSPDTTDSAAIDPLFECSEINNEGGNKDFPSYWTGTTHAGPRGGQAAVYLAFGRALGWMQLPPGSGRPELMDVHGAGAQRSDPKAGDPAAFPRGRGPQGDVVRILNHVRCVRGGAVRPAEAGGSDETETAATRTAPAAEEPPAPPAADEPPAPPPPPAVDPHFHRLDRDGDGKVSRREFDGPRQHFRDLDRNRDGFLEPAEFPAGPPR